MAGRKKKYTRKSLKLGIDRYFNSISRTIQAMEAVDSGKRDERGRPIFKQMPIKNNEGDPIMVTEYVVPPSVSGLCLHLGIERSTWQNYRTEFPEITEEARARIEAYLEGELLTRKKSVQGIIFNLQNNYGWREKREVELGEETRKAAACSMSPAEKLELIMAAAAAQMADESAVSEEDFSEGQGVKGEGQGRDSSLRRE